MDKTFEFLPQFLATLLLQVSVWFPRKKFGMEMNSFSSSVWGFSFLAR